MICRVLFKSLRVIFRAACDVEFEYIHKSQNVTVLLYRLVFPEKYRRVVFDEQVDAVLEDVCLGVAERYQVKFIESGTDTDHVHFLVQSVLRL